MNKADEERQSGTEENAQETSHPQDVPHIRGSAEVEKTHNHDTDTDVDDTSSVSSSWEEDREHGSRPASHTLSRHVSETEVRDGFQNQRDPELGPALMEKVDTTAPNPNDPNLVTWTGPDDPQNPKNWTLSKKWAAVFTVSLFTLISPISSSLVAPALGSIAEELGITEDCKSKPYSLQSPSFNMNRVRSKTQKELTGTILVEKNLTLSIFVLAYAVGPLVYVATPQTFLPVVEF